MHACDAAYNCLENVAQYQAQWVDPGFIGF